MEKREQYHIALTDLFDTLGWRCLMEDLEEQIESAKTNMLAAKSWHEVGVLKGRVQAYTDVLVLPQNIQAHLATIAEDTALEEDPDADL